MAFTKRLIKGQRLSWAEMDNNLSEIEAKWLEIVAISGNALAAANFVGQWPSLTGSLSIPAATYWSGKFWLLLADVVDVTAHEPGVSASWAELVVGDVRGPAGAIAGNIAILDATGKVISDGGVAPAALMPKTGGVFTGDATVPSLNGGQLAGLRNRVINGDFLVWQRGISFGTGGIYTADRWRVAGAAGQAVTLVGDHPTNGTYGFCAQVVNTSGAQWLDQRIERALSRDLVGKTVTVSAYFKVVSLGGLGAAVIVSSANASNDFSATTTIATSSSTTSASWTRLSVTFVVPVGADNGILIRLVTSGGVGGAATVRVASVQLEVGEVPTPFENRPYGLELALCQRYYFRTAAFTGYQGFAVLSNQARFAINFPVEMRINPTSLEQSGTAANYVVTRNGGGTVTSNAVPTFIGAGLNAATVRLDFASGLTAGEGLQSQGTAGSFFGFSAEL